MGRMDRIELWVHDHVLKNAAIRHFLYGMYQRALYLVSPKIKCEGAVKRITPDDRFEYFFGYYDKCPWSSDGKRILALRAENARDAADSSKTAQIVAIHAETGNIEEIAQTHCWNVQQGCMAQWMSEDEILYNDFRDGKYCAVILHLESGAERILPMPVYTVSADGTTALTLDFSRLHRLRPGYGYCNLEEETKNEKCPDAPCIWKINLKTGEVKPLLKYTDFSAFEPKETMNGAEHKVNHLMISPSGKRFMALHRWFQNGQKYTRLVTCNMDGTELYNLSDDDFASHFCWKNDREILGYLNKRDGGKGYYLLEDRTANYKRCWKKLVMDGHPSFSPDGQFAVTDTYPDRRRIQSLYVMQNEKVVRLARVFSPFQYSGDTRCDLHPRWSRDGKQICMDAAFSGKRSVCVVNAEKALMDFAAPSDAGKGDEKPAVSVIIPCYNGERFLDEALESLEAQIFSDFEVICVNDGSTDGTLDRLNAWKTKGTLRMRVIDQENGGVGKARNRGIEAARGDSLLFLDADDIYHPYYIKSLLNAKQGHDLAYCRLSRNLRDVYQCGGEETSAQTEPIRQTMEHFLYQMGSYGFYCCLYSREKLDSIGLRFDENTQYGEDREFVWKYLSHCESAAWIDLPLYGYRMNHFSVTQQSVTWRKTDLLSAIKRTEDDLLTRHCPFADRFCSFMYPRAMWSVAKTFAEHGEKALFAKLMDAYDVRGCMKRTVRGGSALVRVASGLYLIHPKLFYHAIAFYGRPRRK